MNQKSSLREVPQFVSRVLTADNFRSGGVVSRDEEGVDLPGAEAAHRTAVRALADGIRDLMFEGSTDVQFGVEVRDDIGRVLDVTARLDSKIYRKQ
jgi:hypothetical protein